MKYSILFAITVLFFSCSSVKELSALKDCRYTVQKADQYVLNGKPLNSASGLQNLSLSDILSLAGALSRKDLPLNFNLYVNVQNPNTKDAAFNKMDWMFFSDDTQIAEGSINERFEVDAGESNVWKIPVTVNMYDIFSNEKAPEIIAQLINADFYVKDDLPEFLSLRVKPYFMIAGKQVPYPGTVKVYE
jgi:hypothetical protein